MLAASIEAQPDRWAVLQNHPRSPNPDDDTFYALLAALDAGWRVEPPVYVRPRWGSEHAGQQMYHFILRRETGTTMVSVADGNRIRAFVQEHGLEVNGPRR
jgi:hypothetical protein